MTETVYLPDIIPRHEVPPSTDDQWADALKLYGRDRDADYLQRAKAAAPSKPHSRLIPRRGLEGSDDSDNDDDADISGTSVRAERRERFGLAGVMDGPPIRQVEEEDWASGSEERKRLRACYERDGWLPGPKPGRKMLLRRRQVIRRLGLAGAPTEYCERRNIMAQYAMLAEQAFQCWRAVVVIFRDEVEEKFTSDRTAEPHVFLASEAAMAHSTVHTQERCMVIGDLHRDWRIKGNPRVKAGEASFMAAAPLRYLRKNPPVDFGALTILDDKPREAFTKREQDMLMNMANMLVYQLATLQSEALAEKSSAMYEQSLAFLRRSVVPAPSQAPRNRDEKKAPKESKRKKRRAPSMSRRDSPASMLSSLSADGDAEQMPSLPSMVVKYGPKESVDAKKRALLTDTQLFSDGAETLRHILGADSVAVLKMDEYQLYFRRKDQLELNAALHSEPHLNPLITFIHGQPWPEDSEPVVHHVPAPGSAPIVVLGSSSKEGSEFHFSQPGQETLLSELSVRHFKTRQFWWAADDSDELCQRLIACMPDTTQTVLINILVPADGRMKTATIVAWDRPPASFADESRLALPFVYILSGISMAAMSILKIRQMEQSQISYSNLQAHELRTPLHQILAITQLLRSSMLDLAEAPQNCTSYLNSVQQIRDLIPILDAIDTSGQTLHGIVDNILSFLDLKARDYMQSDSASSPRVHDSPSSGPRTLGLMFEEVIHEVFEESTRSRRAAMQPLNTIETVFEMTPPDLGEMMMEDGGGALRKAFGKILSNAYKFIEGEGYVRISVSEAAGYLPPEGCQEMCQNRRICIEIADNGPGMDEAFVTKHLGEPWAKQDAFTAGSGLSVHLAYRIIELMGGQMQIASAPKRGCIVNLEVPLQRRSPMDPPLQQPIALPHSAASPLDTTPTATPDPSAKRKIALLGFDRPEKATCGLPDLGQNLRRQYLDLGYEVVSGYEADLIVVNGDVEEMEAGKTLMEHAKAEEIVFLVAPGHEPHPEVTFAARRHGKNVRRINKPITSNVIRQTLHKPRPHVEINLHSHGDVRKTSLVSTASGTRTPERPGSPRVRMEELPPAQTPPPALVAAAATSSPSMGCKFISNLAQLWKPKNMSSEEAIARLSLGAYFSAGRRGTLARTPSVGSSGRTSSVGDESTPPSSHTTVFDTPAESELVMPLTPDMDDEDEQESDEAEPETVKVLVVEDNAINRKILVRILSTKLPIEIHEAQDGQEAIDRFKELSGPIVVLLDINMPRKDGFQACVEMRAHERATPDRPKAHVIAVTALSGEEQKNRGLVESGMDRWMTKPCGKQVITTAVEDARKLLLGIKDEVVSDDGEETNLFRRATV